jgi:hypothetical protein
MVCGKLRYEEHLFVYLHVLNPPFALSMGHLKKFHAKSRPKLQKSLNFETAREFFITVALLRVGNENPHAIALRLRP